MTPPRDWLGRHGALIRYVGVGVFNSCVDFGLFTLLSVVFGIYPLWANIASTTVVMCLSFALNGKVVFRTDRMTVAAFAEFVAVTCFSAYVLQSGVIWVVLWLHSAIAIPVTADVATMAAKICAMAVGMIWNYLGYRWLFSRRKKHHEQ